MKVLELWTKDDDARLKVFRACAAKGDLVGALLALEAADADRSRLVRGQLDSWGAIVAARRAGQTPHADAQVLAAVLGDELDLHGDAEGYHRVENSLLSQVVATRRGLPILLAVVWLEVGRRAGITLDGVGMPLHFIARVGGQNGVYVDPFDRGKVLTLADCKRIVQRLSRGTRPWNDAYLKATPAQELLERVVRNLMNSHTRTNDGVGLYRDASFLCALDAKRPEPLLQRAALAEQLGAFPLAADDYRAVRDRFPKTDAARVANEWLGRHKAPTLLH